MNFENISACFPATVMKWQCQQKGKTSDERELGGSSERVLILCYIGFRSCKNEMKTLVCPLGYNAALLGGSGENNNKNLLFIGLYREK